MRIIEKTNEDKIQNEGVRVTDYKLQGGQTENPAAMCVQAMCVFCYDERFKPHVLCKKTHPNHFHTPTGWNGLKDAKGEASWEGVGCSIRPACFAATKKK